MARFKVGDKVKVKSFKNTIGTLVPTDGANYLVQFSEVPQKHGWPRCVNGVVLGHWYCGAAMLTKIMTERDTLVEGLEDVS